MSSGSFYKNLTEEALICGRCGNCRPDCPVFKEIGWESASPRAKLSLAREIFGLKTKSAIDSEFAKRISQCTMCGACTQNCAARIDLQALWQDLRAELVASGKAPAAYNLLSEKLKSNRNISTFPNADRLEWAEDLDEAPENLDRAEGASVLYFVGCVSSFFPRAAQIPLAMVQLFDKAGVNYTTLGEDEWCCGFPLLAAGHAADIAEFVRHNVEAVRRLGVQTLVTGCSSCYHTWTGVYPGSIGEEMGFEVLHSTQFLARLIREGRLIPKAMGEAVTYHDPCDLGRNGGVFDAPREIIRAIPGLSFAEMATCGPEATCCGGGGNLQSVDAGLSEAIARRRIREAAETGATLLVSACQQCEQMLEKAARAENLPLEVIDAAELLLRSVEV